jgi:hypothetical protein
VLRALLKLRPEPTTLQPNVAWGKICQWFPQSTTTDEGEFSSAFGLMSTDYPNVIAGLATDLDGAPFFSNAAMDILRRTQILPQSPTNNNKIVIACGRRYPLPVSHATRFLETTYPSFSEWLQASPCHCRFSPEFASSNERRHCGQTGRLQLA